MSMFDEFIDEFVFMAKNAADAASKKTGEVVETGKLKYQQKQSEWDLEKAYAKLGAIYYESKHSDEDLTDAILLATSEINELKAKIDRIEDSLRSYRKVKKCEKCGKDNDAGAQYCSRCGSPLGDEPLDIPVTPETKADEANTDENY